MTRRAAAPAPRPGGAATATATGMLVAAGAAAWSWLLDGSLVRVALLVAVGAVAVLLAVGRLAGRLAGGLLVVWLPAVVWAAGVPAGQLLPQAWPSLVARLTGGVGRLAALGGASGPIGNDPWPLAAWLLGAGAVWVAGAALAASGSSARRRAIAFGVLAAPWIAAVLVGAVAARQADWAAWQGAAVLLAGLLWLAGRRGAVRPAVTLGLAAALVSVAIAQAVGPRTSWFTPASLFGAAPPFRTLQTQSLTYGPLQGRRSGAIMLQVTAAEPALWRMQVLGSFLQDTWSVQARDAPELPQPAARVVAATVRVRGLRNDLVVAPGRIDAVHADGKVRQDRGEAWQVTPAPRQGDAYQVQARLVRATAQQLQRAPPPTHPGLPAYMNLYVPDVPAPANSWRSVAVPLFGRSPDPAVTALLERTPYGPVAALARQLAAGATTQWEVVARVHRYLLDGGRFRYATNLPPQAGPFPLVDFLLRDHVGYCQHFAGAAALLLRLAGVPTRVVIGFATGVRQRDGRFTVRDTDAHVWIEVYFQGYGWVAFNPTPPAAQAQIPRQLDPLAPAPATTSGDHHARGGPGGLATGALLAVLAAVGAVIVRRRRRGRRAEFGQLLAALVRRTGGHIGTSTTLAELGVQLARLIGPHTATLAIQAERARFAPDPAIPSRRPRIRIARALARDLGLMRALVVLLVPAATRRARGRPRRSA
jgi:protein-glutamine gamma-glutamyltransferase